MKIDYYKYTRGRYGTRDEMKGVHYQDGQKIAGTPYMIIVENCEYDSALEGKTIDRKGNVIPCRYPNVQSIYPTDWTVGTWTSLAADPCTGKTLLETAKEKLAICKAHAKQEDADFFANTEMKIGDCWFMTDNLVLFLTFAKHIGAAEVSTRPGKAAFVKTKKGEAFIMPCFHRDEDFIPF